MVAAVGATPAAGKPVLPLRRLLVAVVSLTTIVAASPAPQTGQGTRSLPLRVTYVANEGFLIGSGERRVLVDALFREGVAGYQVSTSGTRDLMERGVPPFESVDLVLATHHHADHFDPLAVGRHLTRNPRALFVSTRQAVDQLRANYDRYDRIADRVRAVVPGEGERQRVSHAGIEVDVLFLHHGRNRPIENLGFLIRIGGRTLLHVGDAMATLDDFSVYELPAAGVDVAFLPYWYLLDEDGRRAVREGISPGRIVVMHVPKRNAPDRYVVHAGGHDALARSIEEAFPGSSMPEKELEEIAIDAEPEPRSRTP